MFKVKIQKRNILSFIFVATSFIGLQAQFNNFVYKKDQSKVNIFDAYARVSLGVRL